MIARMVYAHGPPRMWVAGSISLWLRKDTASYGDFVNEKKIGQAPYTDVFEAYCRIPFVPFAAPTSASET
jgi:hypothetical protein